MWLYFASYECLLQPEFKRKRFFSSADEKGHELI
jgi:hypothetical protein